jgi:hypothetical protein
MDLQLGWGLGMRATALFLFVALIVMSTSARATTYTYVGQPLTQITNCSPCQTGPGLTGSVTFNFDTTTYTGPLSLVDGDTAKFGVYTFPTTVSYFWGPEWGVTGTLYLQSGVVTSWYLFGVGDQQFCGPGPNCEPRDGETVGPIGDSSYYLGYSPNPNSPNYIQFANSTPGAWTEVAAVPEPSTWAMLLIGFAGIGFMSCCRSRSAAPRPRS